MIRATDKASTAASGRTAPGVAPYVSRIAEYLVVAKGDAIKQVAEIPDLGSVAVGSSDLAAALSGVATTPLPIGVRKAGLRTKTAESAGMRVPGWV